MKMSPDQNDRSKWLRELTNNSVTMDRFSQAANTSGNSEVKFKPTNQVTQIRNTTGVLFLTLPEQNESLLQKFLSLFTKKNQELSGKYRFHGEACTPKLTNLAVG